MLSRLARSAARGVQVRRPLGASLGPIHAPHTRFSLFTAMRMSSAASSSSSSPKGRVLGAFQPSSSCACASSSSSSSASSSASVSASTAPELVSVKVDDITVQVPAGSTVMAACEEAGKEIPRFCYHERLSIAGNCRMCLVEVEKAPKPVASCAFPVMPGMQVRTSSDVVKKAREGVLDQLLANHPLDCPICDEGGECELQDITMVHGTDRSRFSEFKRSVEDKDIGPLVKTTMTRCIHCTRCVRFADEVAGVPDLGITGRGNDAEIGMYVPGKPFDSELSGNIVDLCPVGALTSKPSAFRYRAWELAHTESVDVHDAAGGHVRVDTRGNEVIRVMPRQYDEINEEWLHDKGRYAYDGLRRQRLDAPIADGEVVTWGAAFDAIRERLSQVAPSETKFFVGDLVDAEAMVALKDLGARLGVQEMYASTSDGAGRGDISLDLRGNYLFNSTIAGIEDADFVLLVGTNPRMEAPLINARLRKTYLNNMAAGLTIASVGPEANLTYPVKHLGDDLSVLNDVLAGKHPEISARLAEAERPLIIVGTAALNGDDAAEVHSSLLALAKTAPNLVQADENSDDEWNGLSFLQSAAARTGALDLGFGAASAASDKPAKLAFLLGADDAVNSPHIDDDTFVIYQGHHGDAGAERADVILPGCAYTEKDGTYVNTEGRVQHGYPAVPPPGQAREDWKVLRALAEYCGVGLPYDSLAQVRQRLVDVAPHFAAVGDVERPSVLATDDATPATLSKRPVPPLFSNYFSTNVIAKNSVTMAKAAASNKNSANSYL